MSEVRNSLISFVVPVYNEALGLDKFHASLMEVIKSISGYDYEIIYCNDGSSDNTYQVVKEINSNDSRVKLISLSRNFGKESALAAGIKQASGQAIITLDGDGQHPVELIPEFLTRWANGSQVVIGIRQSNEGQSSLKSAVSSLFYRLFNKISGQKIAPGSTDYRLIDAEVQAAFLELKESDRITRGLIDWLGFDRDYIYFTAHAREAGTSSYSTGKLIKLAVDSFVSMSSRPLFVFTYIGLFITSLSFVLGTLVLLEQVIFNDPLNWKFTGTAMLGILILFGVGLLLLSQGILSIYISRIHNQSKSRPLYVINSSKSIGTDSNEL